LSATSRWRLEERVWGQRPTICHEVQADATPRDLFRRAIRLEGPLDEAQRQRLLEIAERCPVHRTLTVGSRIETRAS
jgi:putative redox protein